MTRSLPTAHSAAEPPPVANPVGFPAKLADQFALIGEANTAPATR